MASFAFVWTRRRHAPSAAGGNVQRDLPVPVLNFNSLWRMHAAGYFFNAL